MDPTPEMCKNLIKWVQTLTTERSRSVTEISDGVAMSKILLKISPEHFEKLVPKIKLDVGSNWRLKVSNLKKINESILEYHQDVLNLQVLDVGKPDVVKVGESNDLVEIGKMLRLILGCAVNCNRNQEYINQIRGLEESLQHSIMRTIQQWEEVTAGPSRSGGCSWQFDSDSRVVRLITELDASNKAKEAFSQQVRALEEQVNILQEEKQVYVTENQTLVSQLQEKHMVDTIRPSDNRKQIEYLKEELFKLETIRDDYRAKMLEQEKQIHVLQEKVSELQLAAEEVNRLKDEIDALLETANKVQTLETMLASYKKKLEGYTDIKKEYKILKEKNYEYIQQNLKYEEELNKQNVWKSQSDMYKNQAAELQQRLDEQMAMIDRIEFMNKNMESKFTATLAEKERLVKERDALKEENEEIKLGYPKAEKGAAMFQELVPNELKERLKFLEKENVTLRAGSQDAFAKQTLLDDTSSRVKKLTECNRSLNQRILELETLLEDQKPKEQVNAKEHEKVIHLQEALAAKENEFQALQGKYARNIEKAKEIVSFLDIKTNGSLESLVTNNMKALEEKLITSAFYKLSSACQREAADERVALLSGGQGQSFLSRQRQATPRKAVMPFKSK